MPRLPPLSAGWGREVLLCWIVSLLATGVAVAQSTAFLTIEVDGDLLQHGGVVTIHPIPTPAEGMAAAGADTGSLRISARYVEVQLRYPADGTYSIRFRPAGEGPDTAGFATQLLSVIGADGEGRAARMRGGFEGATSSGGQIIRVLPRNERGGPSEADRTIARWGETQAYADPPPADHRSARALLGVMDDPGRPLPLGCLGDARVVACTVAAERWPMVEALWWRAIAEQRLERLHYHALRRCYDGQGLRRQTCEPDPASDEPRFR